MSEWQDIATAPKDGQFVDLWCRHPIHGGQRSANMIWGDRRGWEDWMGMPLNPGWTVTHWMPLPEPPVEGRG